MKETTVLEGMLQFAAEFRGELETETMLVQGLNDGEAAVGSVAAFLERLRPAIAYTAAAIRPPAEPLVRPADEETFNRAFQRFAERLPRVELITGFEGTAFAPPATSSRISCRLPPSILCVKTPLSRSWPGIGPTAGRSIAWWRRIG